MGKRELSELNLIDDFLFEEALRRGKKGEQFAKILLQTILGKEFRSVKVIAQKNVRGISPGKHGIRMDAYVEASEESNELSDAKITTEIYDIEPSIYTTKSEAKRARYYHSLIDSKILSSGAKYEELQSVMVIIILPYDPFGKGHMIYTIRSKCEEYPEMEYDDGNRTIYLYTKGKIGSDRKALCNMLKYLETSTRENAVDESLREIQELVEEIKHDERVGVSYMKSWERDEIHKEEGEKIALIKQVCKKLEKEKTIPQMADELEAEESEIQRIVEAAKEFAPEYDAEKIYEVAGFQILL